MIRVCQFKLKRSSHGIFYIVVSNTFCRRELICASSFRYFSKWAEKDIENAYDMMEALVNCEDSVESISTNINCHFLELM